MACWLVSAERMVLLKAVCDASTTKSATTAIVSRIITCFLSERFGGRLGTGVFTEPKVNGRLTGIIDAEKSARTRASVDSWRGGVDFVEDRAVCGFGLVGAIKG